MGTSRKWFKKRKLSDEDVGFLYQTNIFHALPDPAKKLLLACMASLTVEAGERFIRQGDEGDSLYLIQEGTCKVVTEKDGLQTLVATRKSGDLVGEMALCTGEKRTAHVSAETDMKLWRMTRAEFDEMCLAYPDLREFITEIVTHRIISSNFVPHRTIGKYVITNLIGEGGWALVYKGIHPTLNMPVAIKMLKHNLAMDADFSGKFQNEAEVIARLKHENIVRVYDIEHLYRTAFIVMEYLSGHSLRHMLDAIPRLSLPRALDLLVQVSRGLHYAHSKGIVHQDIKPANIFIEVGDRAKIVDFGLACRTGTRDEADMPGTPYYIAPEQINGDPVDERTDIYSLGIMTFEMVTGQRPFSGKDVGKILRAHQEEPVPDPRSLCPDLPQELNTFVLRATQKDPARRYQESQQVVERLEHLAKRYVTGGAGEPQSALQMTSLLMQYHERNRLALTRLVEEFSRKIKALGVEIHVADYEPPRMGEQASEQAPEK